MTPDLTGLPTRLSLEYLADIFATAEGIYQGRVFAILGNCRTLCSLDSFLRSVIPPDRYKDNHLWGATFVQDERVPQNEVRLAVSRHKDTARDWPFADDFWRSAEVMPIEPDQIPESFRELWTVRIRLGSPSPQTPQGA